MYIKTNKTLLIKNLIINYLIINGKKSLSEQIKVKVIKRTQKFCNKNHKNLMKFLILKTSPIIKIKQIKKGRKKRLIEFPFLVKKKSRFSQSIKNIIQNSILKKLKQNFYIKLSEKLILNIKNLNKDDRQTIHEYAFKTKKFANFRWFK